VEIEFHCLNKVDLWKIEESVAKALGCLRQNVNVYVPESIQLPINYLDDAIASQI
jgi:hypothetical protein